eukprot:768473-Hanusia_phi.AAC.23
MDPKANEVDMKQFVEETMGLAGDTLGDQEALGRKMSWKEFETRSRMIRSLNQMPFEVLKQLWQAATAVEVMPDELLQPNDELTALICSGSVHLRKSNEHGTSDESRRDAAFYMAKGESFDVHKLYNMGIKAYGGEGGALTILINTKMWKLYRTRILSQHSERLENFLNSVLKFPAKRGFHPFKLRRVPGGTVVVKEGDPVDSMAAVWIRALKAAAIRDECDRLPSARSRSLKVSSSVPNSARLVKPDESRHEKEEGAVSSRSEVVRSKQTDLRNVPDKIPAVRSKNLFSPGTNSETRDSLLAPRTDNLLLVQGRTYEGSKASQ